MPQFIRDNKIWAGAIIVLLALCALVVAHSKGWAADKGGPRAQPSYDAPTPSGWTGVSIDAHGSLATALANGGGPVDIASTGQLAGVALAVNYRFGSSPLVVGADVGYDWVFGDLHTLGINDTITVGGRLGFLATYKTLVYTRAEWIRAQASGGNSDGWGLGGGIEVKLADTPVSVGIEYMHDWMDHQSLGPSIDVSADKVTARLRFNFDSDLTKILR